jgi:hypothetical protein
MKLLWSAIALLAGLRAQTAAPTLPPPNVREIVQRSVDNTTADWIAAPQYDFTQTDLLVNDGVKTSRTSQVLMIDGSPFIKVIGVDGQPRSPSGDVRDVRQEKARRDEESPAARRKRIAEYEKERRQDHILMAEMVKAFDFSLTGEETVNGRRCFVLAATPRSGYQPVSRETRVLEGMRGTLWIDAEQYQWVKVRAEVFRPVEFGLFVARVDPGTEITLEQEPVEGNIWLPYHFCLHVRAKILFFSRDSIDDQTYTGYHHAANAIAARIEAP